MPSITSRTYVPGLLRRSHVRYIGTMDAPGTYAEGMAQATLTLLIRAGVLENGAVEALADEMDRRGSWESEPDAKDAFREVAHGLRVAALHGGNEAPLVDPAVEHRAQFERDQIRRRTARMEQDR